MFEEDLYWPGISRHGNDSEPGSSPASNPASPFVVTPTMDERIRPESPSTPKPTIRTRTGPGIDSLSISDTTKNKKETRRNPSPPLLFYPDTKKEKTIPSVIAPSRRNPSPPSLFYPDIKKKESTPSVGTATRRDSSSGMTKYQTSSSPTASSHTLPRLPALSLSTMLSSPSRAAVNDTVAQGKINIESSRTSVSTSPTISTPSHSHRRKSFAPSSPTTSVSISPFSPVKPSFSYPHLVRTAPTAPVNPRDHTVLETIYAEMHANRFINLAPLSLLPSSLSTWFRGKEILHILNI
jgi:hypothetical protein